MENVAKYWFLELEKF